MYKNNKPVFESGKILKIEMLENLRDFNRDYLDIKYKDYCDGIIKGCDIEVYDNYITINNGIIKYNNTLYLLKEKEEIAYINNNRYMMLKVRFLDHSKEDDFEVNYSDIFLDEDMELKKNEMEICRFKLREGAKLRNNHVDFYDYNTEFDTINILNTVYADNEIGTLPPVITYEFGKELLKLNVDTMWDINFAIACVNRKEPLPRIVIMSYIKNKINIEDKFYSNEEIYNFLVQILNNIKNNKDASVVNRKGRQRMILID